MTHKGQLSVTKKSLKRCVLHMSKKKTNKFIETSSKREFDISPPKRYSWEVDREFEDRFDLREILSLKMFKVIQDIEKKLSKGRIKDKESEKIRIDYLRTYINACNCYMSLSKNSNNYYNEETLRKFIENDDPIVLESESDNE